jgi:hypothetical protein
VISPSKTQAVFQGFCTVANQHSRLPPRWSDALIEAGFAPNAPSEELDEQFVLRKLADVCRHYGRVPATMEMRLYRKIDPEFPNEKSVVGFLEARTIWFTA